MGADLYIPSDKDPVVLLQEEFDKLVKERDVLELKTGANKVLDPATWSNKYDNPKVQAIQDKLNDLTRQMFQDNPYYFRDSYNNSSLLWQMNLSWWTDVIPMLSEMGDDDEVNLLPDAIDRLLSLLEERKDMLNQIEEVESFKYFKEKYRKLVAFLERGKKAGGILASL
jgi:hypothetical protein